MIANDDRIDPDSLWNSSNKDYPVSYHTDNYQDIIDRRILPIDTLQLLEKMNVIESDDMPF